MWELKNKSNKLGLWMVKQGSKSIVIKWKTGGAALSSVTKESSNKV